MPRPVFYTSGLYTIHSSLYLHILTLESICHLRRRQVELRLPYRGCSVPEILALCQALGSPTSSTTYIERFTKELRLAGLVEAFRGPGGGYVDLIDHSATVGDVIARILSLAVDSLTIRKKKESQAQRPLSALANLEHSLSVLIDDTLKTLTWRELLASTAASGPEFALAVDNSLRDTVPVKPVRTIAPPVVINARNSVFDLGFPVRPLVIHALTDQPPVRPNIDMELNKEPTNDIS